MVKIGPGEFCSISSQTLRDRLCLGSIRPVDRLDGLTGAKAWAGAGRFGLWTESTLARIQRDSVVCQRLPTVTVRY